MSTDATPEDLPVPGPSLKLSGVAGELLVAGSASDDDGVIETFAGDPEAAGIERSGPIDMQGRRSRR